MTKALYFKSLNREFHILGVDRKLFFLLMGLCMPLAYSGHLRFGMDILALCVFLVGYGAAVFITRTDGQLLQIYLRHIKYRKYYAAYPGLHAAIRMIKPSVPVYEGNL